MLSYISSLLKFIQLKYSMYNCLIYLINNLGKEPYDVLCTRRLYPYEEYIYNHTLTNYSTPTLNPAEGGHSLI